MRSNNPVSCVQGLHAEHVVKLVEPERYGFLDVAKFGNVFIRSNGGTYYGEKVGLLFHCLCLFVEGLNSPDRSRGVGFSPGKGSRIYRYV